MQNQNRDRPTHNVANPSIHLNVNYRQQLIKSRSEHIKEAQNRDAQIHSSVITGQSNETAAEPLKIPGLQYREINLNGKGFERNLLWQLSWSSLSKLITLMALGYRTQAISIMGREVLQPRGLHGLARDMLDHSKPEIRQIFAILEEPQNYPIMIHCTQGKDRTGLIIALILFLLDVPLETITRDYRLSEAELLPEKDARMVEIREIGLDESFAGCPIDWVDGVKSYVDETYGGVRQYLEQQLDIGPEKQRRIIEALSAGLYEHGKPQSKAALKSHPDRVPSDSPERPARTKKFQTVNDAYYTLSDPSRRQDYDSARSYHFGSSEPADEEIPNQKATGGFPWSAFGFGAKNPAEEETRSNEQFGSVFEDMLRDEGMAEGESARPTKKFWSIVGGLSGGAMGFIVANFPGAVAGAVAGNRLGAVRDARGKSVYSVFLDLPQGDRAKLLSELAAKVFAHAVGS
ncbi:MAG: hypothetical protein M1819_002274 [Sarea resinae]|nr:MAG: hypothetical protein M1819_002274 [Sarea resinae]